GTLVVLGLIEVWHVYVFSFLLGCVRGFDSPSRQAILPYLVPEEAVGDAVSLINVVWQLPRLVGPAVAGLTIAAFGSALPSFYAGVGERGGGGARYITRL